MSLKCYAFRNYFDHSLFLSLPSELSYKKTKQISIHETNLFHSAPWTREKLCKTPSYGFEILPLPSSPPYFLATSPLFTCIFSQFFNVKVSQCHSVKWLLCRCFVSSVTIVNHSHILFSAWQFFILRTTLASHWAKKTKVSAETDNQK